MKKQHFAVTTLAAALLLLTACGSTDLGGILGGGGQASSSTSGDIYATVYQVDTRNSRIDVTTNDNRNATIYYDNRTTVSYRGQQGSPSQLERGDRVTIRMAGSGGQAVADTITVTQSVSEGTSGTGSSTYPTYPNTPSTTYPSSSAGRVTGTVNYIDTGARLINLTASYVNNLRNSTNNNTFTVYYEPGRTRVLFQGRTYNVEDLERGDVVDIATFSSGNQYVAETITVTRNVRQ